MKYLWILLWFFFSCSNDSRQVDFECNEFWISQDSNWKIAYEDFRFCTGPLILRSNDSTFAVLFPGSLTLRNDTIRVSQEAGFPNDCIEIGKVTDDEVISVDYDDSQANFRIINDSMIELGQQVFTRTEKVVLNGCWCDWR
jgi:hypothetical protein